MSKKIYINKLSEAAAMMGKIKSEKKAKAARENGKKGGRPNFSGKVYKYYKEPEGKELKDVVYKKIKDKENEKDLQSKNRK